MSKLNKARYWYWNMKAETMRLKFVIYSKWLIGGYKFKHWLFSWNVDCEGDIVFSLARRVHFIKYKEHTIIKIGTFNYAPAAKYVEARVNTA